MSARQLALSLRQAARSRAALNAVRPRHRGLATPVNHAINTESTTLSNGLTVGTFDDCAAWTSSCGGIQRSAFVWANQDPNVSGFDLHVWLNWDEFA